MLTSSPGQRSLHPTFCPYSLGDKFDDHGGNGLEDLRSGHEGLGVKRSCNKNDGNLHKPEEDVNKQVSTDGGSIASPVPTVKSGQASCRNEKQRSRREIVGTTEHGRLAGSDRGGPTRSRRDSHAQAMKPVESADTEYGEIESTSAHTSLYRSTHLVNGEMDEEPALPPGKSRETQEADSSRTERMTVGGCSGGLNGSFFKSDRDDEKGYTRGGSATNCDTNPMPSPRKHQSDGCASLGRTGMATGSGNARVVLKTGSACEDSPRQASGGDGNESGMIMTRKVDPVSARPVSYVRDEGMIVGHDLDAGSDMTPGGDEDRDDHSCSPVNPPSKSLWPTAASVRSCVRYQQYALTAGDEIHSLARKDFGSGRQCHDRAELTRDRLHRRVETKKWRTQKIVEVECAPCTHICESNESNTRDIANTHPECNAIRRADIESHGSETALKHSVNGMRMLERDMRGALIAVWLAWGVRIDAVRAHREREVRRIRVSYRHDSFRLCDIRFARLYNSD